MENVLDEIIETKATAIPEGLIWWEKRRFKYNLFCLITGIISLLIISSSAPIDYLTLFPVVVLGIAANCFYTIGWIAELMLSYYLKIDLAPFRKVLFFLGTGFSILFLLSFSVVAWLVENDSL